MKKETAIAAAKKFCDSLKYISDESRAAVMVYAPKFLQSMIEKGGVFTYEDHQSLKNEYQLLVEKYNFCRDEQEENRQEYLEHITELESTVSSAGKEVKTPFDDDLLKASYKLLEKRNRELEKEVQHYINQFKSAPANLTNLDKTT